MEWFLGTVVGVMLLLLIYSMVSTFMVLNKKVQPHLDSLFDSLYVLLRHGARARRTASGRSKPN